MKSEKTTYTIQVKQALIVSREIKASNFDEAIEKANELLANHDEIIQAKKGWTHEFPDDIQIVGIFG